MKKLTLIAISAIFPALVNAHPGHDQSMTFVHAFEAFSIVLAVAAIAALAIRYLTHKD